ncbi:hypothetical protein RHS02_07391, partial [Rhizoctonia solani]
MASSPGLEYVTLAHHFRLAAKYFMLASFVFMIYDHMITFAEEVDRVWQQEWTGATWLFFLNRYLTELQFIVNLHFMIHIGLARWVTRGSELHSHVRLMCRYLVQACEDFIPFPGASTLISIAIAEKPTVGPLTQSFPAQTDEITALYQRNPWILALLGVFWVGQVIVMGTVMRHPTRLRLPEGFVGCIQGGEGSYVGAFWLAPLATDSLVFLLTVFKSLGFIYKTKCRVPLIHVILRDGILYFAIILFANLLNCFLYYLAPPSIKVIGASFSQIITVVMISRLQLNLRSESICFTPRMPTSQLPPLSSPPIREKEKQVSGTVSTLSYYFEATVEDLGKDLAMYQDVPDDGTETTQIIEGPRCSCAKLKCAGHAFGCEPAVELEMGPMRPISSGMTGFAVNEVAYVDRVVLVSPTMARIYKSQYPDYVIPRRSVVSSLFPTESPYDDSLPAFVEAATGLTLSRGDVKDLSFRIASG